MHVAWLSSARPLLIELTHTRGCATRFLCCAIFSEHCRFQSSLMQAPRRRNAYSDSMRATYANVLSPCYSILPIVPDMSTIPCRHRRRPLRSSAALPGQATPIACRHLLGKIVRRQCKSLFPSAKCCRGEEKRNEHVPAPADDFACSLLTVRKLYIDEDIATRLDLL